MSKNENNPLSRRERQIMDICLEKEPVSARDVWASIPDQPSYATVRKLLTILVEKGELKRKLEGKKFLYQLARSRKMAAKSAARRLLDTFYRGSVEEAVMGLLGAGEKKITPEELERISKMIETAKTKENNKPKES